MKPIYRAVKRISGKESLGQGTFPGKSNGTLCKSEEEALLRSIEFYSTALNHPTAQPCPDLEHMDASATVDQRIPLDAPSLDEVLAAINKLNNGRSPGSDSITAELLKHSASTSAELLLKLFHSVWKSAVKVVLEAKSLSSRTLEDNL